MKGAKASPPPPRRRSRRSRRRARAPAPRSTRSPSATRRPRAASSPRSPSSSSPTSSARSAAASTPTLEQLRQGLRQRRQRLVPAQPAARSTTTRCRPPIAAEAAREQGKFWQMHDKLFANQQALDRPNLEKYAQELGLDMGKFKAALDSEKSKERIKTRHGRRGQVRRARHAQLLHQRPPLPRRAAVRGVQGASSTRRSRRPTRRSRRGTPRGQALRRRSPRTAWTRRPRRRRPPGQPDDKTRFRADDRRARR